jgi:Nif-specific regulatory protein
MNKNVRRISTSAINMMMAYHWPGNVRELQNCIEHAVLLSTEGVIRGSHLPPTLQMPDVAEGSQPPGLYRLRVDQLERDLLSDALKRHGGCVASAAKEIGITERMVRYKIKKLSIDHRQFTAR